MSSSTVSIPNLRAARRGPSPEAGGSAEPTIAGAASASRPATLAALAPLTHFELAERLVQIWIRNQRNLNRLEELEARIEAARPSESPAEASLPNPGVERLAILLRLRADDRMASALLDEFEARRRAAAQRPRAFSA